jgi:hypothetical protein
MFFLFSEKKKKKRKNGNVKTNLDGALKKKEQNKQEGNFTVS